MIRTKIKLCFNYSA